MEGLRQRKGTGTCTPESVFSDCVKKGPKRNKTGNRDSRAEAPKVLGREDDSLDRVVALGRQSNMWN